jgi:hypothetical protein
VIAAIVVLALLVAACGGPAGSPRDTGSTGTATAPPGRPSTTASAPTAIDPSKIPEGRIAFMRVDPDKVERYFVVDSLGTNEHALYETRGCACIRWSPNGAQIWTVTETDTGLRYTTMDPDGSNVVVHTPDITTLNLAPGFGSADGGHVGFFGWDDTDPTRTGVWAANTNLTDLHQVTGVPDGVLSIDPIGMSADGSHIYFFGDLGVNTDNGFDHAGNIYVIASDGTGQRQLNPAGTKTEITGAGLSADGRRLAFTAWESGSRTNDNALFVVDRPNGEGVQVTDWTPGLWGAAWAPSGEWIALSQEGQGAAVASLIRPDGSGLRPISDAGLPEFTFGPVWSPDGTHFLVRRGYQTRNDLWIMDLDGNFVWQVTHKPAAYDIYAWAPLSDG